jgi:hypothetical protein
MREINKIAEGLFEKIRDRFEDVSLGDENAHATQDPQKARFFNFDYVVDGRNYGNITLSVIDETSLKVYFSKNISHDLDDEQRKQWYSFLKELREFAKRNLLSFEPRDITRSTLKHRDIQQVSKSDSTYDKDEVIGESRLYGTSRSSYENDGPVRLIIRHSDHINPESRGSRSRKIRAMYLETAEGERFKLPHNSLRYGRAMARHVSEGGSLTDEFGQHITEIAEECSKLRPFKAAMVRRVFEDGETQAMVEAAFEYHSLLKDTLNKMGGRKGYQQCKEQFVATSTSYVPEEEYDADSIKERFVKRTYNERMNDALPIVHKAYNMKKTNKMAEAFESWAQGVSESWNEDINVDNLADILAEELPIGVDAVNAINALRGVINSDDLEHALLHASKENTEADARDIILSWIEENDPMVYQELMNEIGDTNTADEYGAANGGMDGEVNEEQDAYADEQQVEEIQSAIIRRILGNVSQHSELIMKAGPDGVMNAARDVASFHAPVEELGSSDISAMVREVYTEVGVDYPELSETPLRQTRTPSKKARDAKYYDHLARTLGENLDPKAPADSASPLTHSHDAYCDACDRTADQCICDNEELDEGRVKEVAIDLEQLTDEEFQAKYGKSKEDMKAALSETQGQDYVNKKEKLAKAMAHRAPRQPEQSFMDKVKSTAKGAKAWVQGKDDSMYESQEDNLAEMRRLAGLE